VKHLNPRQGITTRTPEALRSGTRPRVKHLNPRQGITTWHRLGALVALLLSDPKCETPKSPPGDYNFKNSSSVIRSHGMTPCETPKSPPGDYNSVGADTAPDMRGDQV